MKRKIFTFIILVFVVSGLVGCDAKKDTSITIGVMPSENILPLVYAKQHGIFEKYGLDVNVEVFKSAVDRDAALQSGNLDGIATDMLSVVFLNNAAFNIKITCEDITNFKVISVAPLNEKISIGVSKSTVIEYIAEKYMEKTYGAFELVYIPAVPVRLELLSKKELDMAVLPDPLASVPKNSTVLDSSNDMLLYPGVHAFTADACENKDLEGFYKAYNEAVAIINQSEYNKFMDILTGSIGFSEDMFSGYALPYYNRAIPAKASEFDQVMTWMIKKGYSDQKYDLSDVSDFSYIE